MPRYASAPGLGASTLFGVRLSGAEPHLLEHDFFLELELGLVEDGVDADVGEHLDGRNRTRHRQYRMIERVVERGSSVHPSADTFDIPVHEAPGARGCALEEHVLEVVGKAELQRGLVAASGTYPQLYCDDLAGAKLLNDDADAVRQNVADGSLDDRRGLRGAGDGAAAHGQSDEQCKHETPRQAHTVSQATTG